VHVDVSVAREHVETRVAAALAAGGRTADGGVAARRASMQLHPGDLGWFWGFGAEATAAALRTSSQDGQILAVALLDGPQPVPTPAAGQLRVRVAATSVNLSDWECLRGSPAYARIGGLRLPARRTLGSDIAGAVDDVGAGVTRFQPGDEVYGDNLAPKGGFAEYALVPESPLAHKPTQLTFAEASTIPQAGAIAWQGTESAVVGSRILINGAVGGSGSFAIQLAKRLGAHVTGVDNAAKQHFMRSVGADDVIDYSRDDFTTTTQPYDVVLDLVAQRSVFACRRALVPGGTYRCVGGRCARCCACSPSARWSGD